MTQEQIRPSNRFRQIGAWKMDIGQIEEQTTGWRAVLSIGHLSQRITIKSVDDLHEVTLNLRNGDRYILKQIEEQLITLANATALAQQDIEPRHKIQIHREIKTLTSELRGLGVRLPSWA